MPHAIRGEISTHRIIWVWEEAKLSRESQCEDVEGGNVKDQRAEVSLEHRAEGPRAKKASVLGWGYQQERGKKPSTGKTNSFTS